MHTFLRCTEMHRVGASMHRVGASMNRAGASMHRARCIWVHRCTDHRVTRTSVLYSTVHVPVPFCMHLQLSYFCHASVPSRSYFSACSEPSTNSSSQMHPDAPRCTRRCISVHLGASMHRRVHLGASQKRMTWMTNIYL